MCESFELWDYVNLYDFFRWNNSARLNRVDVLMLGRHSFCIKLLVASGFDSDDFRNAWLISFATKDDPVGDNSEEFAFDEVTKEVKEIKNPTQNPCKQNLRLLVVARFFWNFHQSSICACFTECFKVHCTVVNQRKICIDYCLVQASTYG